MVLSDTENVDGIPIKNKNENKTLCYTLNAHRSIGSVDTHIAGNAASNLSRGRNTSADVSLSTPHHTLLVPIVCTYKHTIREV